MYTSRYQQVYVYLYFTTWKTRQYQISRSCKCVIVYVPNMHMPTEVYSQYQYTHSSWFIIKYMSKILTTGTRSPYELQWLNKGVRVPGRHPLQWPSRTTHCIRAHSLAHWVMIPKCWSGYRSRENIFVCDGCVWLTSHYSDVMMSALASQITGVSVVCLTVCSGADQRKHQSSASLAFVRGIHRWQVDPPHKGK